MKSVIGILIILLVLLPGFDLIGKAQGPSPMVGIVLPDKQTEASAGSGLKKALFTLKQAKLEYSIVHTADLASFKGTLLVLPLDNTVSPSFLDRFIQLKPSMHKIILPLGSTLKPKLAAIAKPLGSYAVLFNQTLVVNWNWHDAMPVSVWNQITDLWQAEDSSLTLAPTSDTDDEAYFNAIRASRIMLAMEDKPTPPKDSNPDAMYDFDGATKINIDRTTLERRRSVESQDAIAAFYNDRMRELADMEEMANHLLTQASGQPNQQAELQKALTESSQQRSKFETAWFQQNYTVALPAYEKAKNALMNVLFAKLPASQIEGRAIWLDRGSIVNAGGPEGLRQLIRTIGQAGFNIIYFETVNAGYPIYPSTLVEQNPQVKGWDPLEVAVDEAHKHGIELHAWVWTFAVGNTRHNRILGQPDSYPGPILSQPELASEALRGSRGELVQPEQYEYWLSPASAKARKFLIAYFSEIVRNYKVDGLQLDYIRYPFQKPNTPVGFEPFELSRFTAETGLTVNAGNEESFKAWEAWKAFQVTSFVKDLSETVHTINPDIKVSAAVFPLTRHSRMLMIQQDWETWVRNGWVDTLSPMAYSQSARSLQRMVEYIHNVGGDKTLVYPGLSLSKLNAVQLLDTLEICRRTGVMGTTLFATTQLGPDTQLLLQSGPYKQRHIVSPHKDPVFSSLQVISETQTAVRSLLTNATSMENHETLTDIATLLNTLSETLNSTHQQSDISSVLHDNTTQLQQLADRWTPSADKASLEAFQAKTLKEMVEKVVRMVNYTSYQLANHVKPALAKQ